MSHFEAKSHDRFVFGKDCKWGRVAGWGVYSNTAHLWITVSQPQEEAVGLANKLNKVMERRNNVDSGKAEEER